MSIYSKLVSLGPKLAQGLKALPAGRLVHLTVLATGTYVLVKKAVQAVKGEFQGS